MLAFTLIGFGVILVFTLLAQWKVKSAFAKYSQVPAASGMTGAEAAHAILKAAGINDVEVAETQDFLGDHYDPTNKRLCLSPDVYNTPSVAALGIAAHECGHAIQHKVEYAPLKLRAAILKPTVIAGNILPIVTMGLFFGYSNGPMGMFLVKIAFFCYLAVAAFQLVTLPVEFDATRRAKVILGEMGMIRGDENRGVNSVLDSAALTYIAAFAATLFHLIRLFLIMQSNRDRE